MAARRDDAVVSDLSKKRDTDRLNMPMIWLANPLYVVTLVSFVRRRPNVISIVATIILSILFYDCHGVMMPGIGPDFIRYVGDKLLGYYLW